MAHRPTAAARLPGIQLEKVRAERDDEPCGEFNTYPPLPHDDIITKEWNRVILLMASSSERASTHGSWWLGLKLFLLMPSTWWLVKDYGCDSDDDSDGENRSRIGVVGESTALEEGQSGVYFNKDGDLAWGISAVLNEWNRVILSMASTSERLGDKFGLLGKMSTLEPMASTWLVDSSQYPKGRLMTVAHSLFSYSIDRLSSIAGSSLLGW
ncbi:hypothetical protein B0H17DRAFT_1135213 [Mycena rosella]|uniref:Uncharacterized protein n=1 Tax=Mycena rosella TaxID=1033263 RepID=A0AAD7DGS9_MYCRO|nr:hypothetical protein B0H17DRAFT_1135213 [Mycena rosella]